MDDNKKELENNINNPINTDTNQINQINPTTPVEPTYPTTPVEPTMYPTTPVDPTMYPTTQADPTINPTTQADPTINPTTPVDPTINPTTPVDPTINPTTPVDPTIDPSTPVVPTMYPTTPVDPTMYPTTPVDPTTNPTTQADPTNQADPNNTSENTDPPEENKKELSKKVKIIILLLLFLGAGILLFLFNQEDKKSQDDFAILQDIAKQPDPTPEIETEITPEIEQTTQSSSDYLYKDDSTNVSGGSYNNSSSSSSSSSNSNSNSNNSTSSNLGISQNSFNQLYEMNNDFTSWITIPNTNVDYPIMQSVYEANFYLNKDFYKEYSSYGVPYLDDRYNIETSQNALIYGHSMTNTTMFADLLNYKSLEYFTNNKTIHYTDKNGYTEYKIFAVFEINTADEFDYHNYINMDSNRYAYFITNVLKRSLHNGETIPQFGDKLITLSTCENNSSDIRFVVVGVAV